MLGLTSWALRSRDFDIPKLLPTIFFIVAGALLVLYFFARLVAPLGKAYVYFEAPRVNPHAGSIDGQPIAGLYGTVSNRPPGQPATDVAAFLTVHSGGQVIADRVEANWSGQGSEGNSLDLPPDGRPVFFGIAQEQPEGLRILGGPRRIETQASLLKVKVELRGQGMDRHISRRYTIKSNPGSPPTIKRRLLPW